MTPVTSFAGKTVALFGLGGSGLATARALVAGGARVVCWDDSAMALDKARGLGLEVQDLGTANWSWFASFVLTPGVPLTHPRPHWTVEKAKAAGVEIIGDIELFCRERAKL
ncbi:MAG: UDP-N-acetylmuramoyl-L-alanine--D-glutamate ligase, partial [Methylobacteriaceae bacterium]|nr:UDP-N-acetylmuramoyl-L-alanine--D-glutamate ligase [Methylobacteriaceae bacterium]